MTTPKKDTKAKKLTKFRVHYRRSDKEGRFTHDCDAEDIGAAHTAARLSVGDKDVRVFIDKTKVLREDA